MIIWQLIECFQPLSSCLEHAYTAVRHMASRCFAMLTRPLLASTMEYIILNILPWLGASDNDIKRQGATESLARIFYGLMFVLGFPIIESFWDFPSSNHFGISHHRIIISECSHQQIILGFPSDHLGFTSKQKILWDCFTSSEHFIFKHASRKLWCGGPLIGSSLQECSHKHWYLQKTFENSHFLSLHF